MKHLDNNNPKANKTTNSVDFGNEPLYVCPVEGCTCYVITWFGPLWACGKHGEFMVYKGFQHKVVMEGMKG